MTRGDTGLFITIEGGDGAGKTTQTRLLADKLARRGVEVCLLHEPGGTCVGEKIRTLLLDRSTGDMDPIAELMLYEAARAQLVAETVEPALAAGKVVLCDRFVDSTVAYQGYGRGLGADIVRRLNEISTRGRMPDRTVLLQLDPAIGLGRAAQRAADGAADRMEAAGAAFHARVQEGFTALAQADPERIRAVDATGVVSEVHARVCAMLEDLLVLEERPA